MTSSPAFSIVRRALCVLAFLAPSIAAQERADVELRHRAETSARYGRAQWTRGLARAGLANDLALAGYRAGELESEQGLLVRSYARDGRPDAQPAFVLETRVADTVDAAEEQLVTWLAGVQSAQ